ncbi:MAG: J domain-containing protein [Leptolyngbyaceae cyanobacterium bins.59]|nr:J domain-containing protein [Leptolyngbyaceae cyanobacterium bins.59]
MTEHQSPHSELGFDSLRKLVSYYSVMGIPSTASAQEIRSAYRKLSKLYHPDTTQLPSTIALAKFQQLNEAYATLNQPELRSAYDRRLDLQRQAFQAAASTFATLHASPSRQEPKTFHSRHAYLDPDDRPLSAGELFALFILILTFVGCLFLAILVGVTRWGWMGSTAADTAHTLLLGHFKGVTPKFFLLFTLLFCNTLNL